MAKRIMIIEVEEEKLPVIQEAVQRTDGRIILSAPVQAETPTPGRTLYLHIIGVLKSAKAYTGKETVHTPLIKHLDLPYDMIISIEPGKGNYRNCVFISAQANGHIVQYVTRMTLIQVLDELPDHFHRIHRNCILNFNKIKRPHLPTGIYTDHRLFMIGETYLKTIREALFQHGFTTL